MAELNKSLTAMDWLSNLTFTMGSNLENDLNIREVTTSFHSSGESDCHTEDIGNCEVPELTPPMQVNLEGKPSYSYAHLITAAILSTKNQRMTLSEIYQWISDNFAYYREAGNGWKNSVRHNLSLSKAFIRVPRPRNDPGKGSYWTLADKVIDIRPYKIGENNSLKRNATQDQQQHEEQPSPKRIVTNENNFFYQATDSNKSPLLFTSSLSSSPLQSSHQQLFCSKSNLSFDNLNLSNSFRKLYDDLFRDSSILDDVSEISFTTTATVNGNALPSITSCMRTLSSAEPQTPSTIIMSRSSPADEDDEAVVLDDDESVVNEYLTAASTRINGDSESRRQFEMVKSSLKQALTAAVSFDWSQVDMRHHQELTQCLKKAECTSSVSLSTSQLWELNSSINRAIAAQQQPSQDDTDAFFSVTSVTSIYPSPSTHRATSSSSTCF
ncbi:Forkhead box protein J2 [Cichlidogyrus casuarinus]|uniref:Forkhead box protein J2 n=1 Tax=Cichlidogyrus casuarinus TaxID=1844966 RepID=A0ABD2QHE7_9PLAT